MSVLTMIITREKIRNRNMIEIYSKELDSLPKGKIIPKEMKGNLYYYLYYREGKKVVSKYVGNNKSKIKSLQEKLDRRYQVENLLKKLKEEKNKIQKMEAIL